MIHVVPGVLLERLVVDFGLVVVFASRGVAMVGIRCDPHQKVE